MITLITGVPGSGKTLRAVFELAREAKAGRRLVVNGVNGLLLDHVLLSDDDTRRWHECVEQNDVLVIDEAQRIWPPVSQGTKPTPEIEALHVHRHMGVDIVLITQHPNRINKTVRDLVGRHVHVRRLFGLRRAMLYEWDSAHNPSSGFRDAVKTVWRYPKRVFELYRSAELHTKPKAVIPKALYVAPLALIAAGWFGWRAFEHMAPARLRHSGGGAAAASAVAMGASAASGAVSGSGSKVWRLVGRYSVDGQPSVIVSNSAGELRVVPTKGFRGDGRAMEGMVDGERVGYWTGAASGVSVAGASK